MTIIIFALLVLLYSIPSFVPSCHASTNLALGKPYTISPLPSYPLSAPPTDRTSLTDGKYTASYFWTQKTTVGWHPVKFVEILIDLEKVALIDGISFSTARGIHAGVYYSPHIYAFVGPDKNHLLYVGDIAADPDNVPGEYRTKRFLLNGIGSKGRYVLLKIITSKSNSVFCDEIEVLEGKNDKGRTGSLSIGAARTLIEQARWLGMGSEIMDRLALDFMSISAAQPALVDEKYEQDIKTMPPRRDVETLEAAILKFRGNALRSKIPGKDILIETVNPWSQITPAFSPSRVPVKDISLVLPQGGYDHASFFITNLSLNAREMSILLSRMPEGSPKLTLFEVPFVKSAAMEYMADPIVPLSGPLNLRSGESKMIFLTAAGKNPGVWHSTLNITSGETFSQAMAIDMIVSQVALPKEQTLNAVNWGYLDFNPTKNCKSSAASDLSDHHTNVLVVPPPYLQGANQAKPVNLSSLGAYIKQHKGLSKILLGIGLGDANHRTVAGEYPFLSKAWQVNFRKWYEEAVKIVVAAGFHSKQLYIYPYDEMEGTQIDDFIKLSKWAKNEIPGIQFYATLGSKNSEKTLPYLDIAQVVNNDEVLKKFTSNKAELWLYDTKSPAKSQSPYSYYRMMPWKAFLLNYKGIGFWAYADASGSAWDDFDGEYPDYAVIYEGDNSTIISSRRWEAWRMGIEDYELLAMYGKLKGIKAAKELAKKVLDNQADDSIADDIRRKILKELSL